MKTFYIDVNSIAWLGMPGHTQDINCLLPEILMIKESCNLIGQEHI